MYAVEEGADRDSMPADIRRAVLVEAGHRCAIPTCRYIEVDIHHIIPWSKCKKHEYENLIALCPNCHRRADREEIDRKSQRLYKAGLRFAHDKYSNVEMDLLFKLYNSPEGYEEPWHPLNELLINRINESGYIATRVHAFVFIDDVQHSHNYISITDKGREFINSFSLG